MTASANLCTGIRISSILFLVLVAAAVVGDASVSVSCAYYNSGSSLSDSVFVENAIYSDVFYMDRMDTVFRGAGKVLDGQKKGRFSHHVVYEEGGRVQKAGISGSSESAYYGWNAQLGGLEVKEVAMAQKYRVQGDGLYQYTLSDGRGEIGERLKVDGGSYEGTSEIGGGTMETSGSGEDLGNVYLEHQLYVEEGDRRAYTTLLHQGGDAYNGWKGFAKLSSDETNLGMGLICNALDGKASSEMVGGAAKFPTQHLPPGDLILNRTLVYVYGDPPPEDGDPISRELIERYKTEMEERRAEHFQDDEEVLTWGPSTGGDGGGSLPGDPEPLDKFEYLTFTSPVEADGTFGYLMRMRFKL